MLSGELLQAEVGPLSLCVPEALPCGRVVRLRVGQLGQGDGDVLVRELLLLPGVVHDVQESPVRLNLDEGKNQGKGPFSL